MRIPFPLSLKVLLWLLLNLLLLGAIGLGVLAANGGLSLDSLVRGPAGRRVQDLGAVLVGEITAVDPAERASVIRRFGAAHGAEFYVFHRDAGPAATKLPDAVLTRVEERPRLAMRDFGRGDSPGEFGGPPTEGGQRGGIHPLDAERGRFFLRTTTPPAYWLGVHVPYPEHAAGPPLPATVVAQVDSAWGVIRLLDLQPWFVAAAVVIAFSILFWLPLVHGITRALRGLTAATERIADGQFDTRVTARRRDELGRLGESVNTMAARLDTLVNGQKRFLGDVAHELGSPLARLQVAVEILEQRADTTLREPIGDVREEVQHMSALVGELLAFTKAGLRPRAAELVSVALAPLVDEACAREDASGRVRREIEAGLSVVADAALLGRAIGNLVRNAVRYAGHAGAITLFARRERDRVIVTIEDEGPGVPADALARLGEPFYRPESARTRETGGVGLGLAIVRSSLAACGGEVRFANRVPRGFRAEVVLTAAR